MYVLLVSDDRKKCSAWELGFGTEAFLSYTPGSSVSAQKPFYLILSSLQNCSDQEILVWLNSFFLFFGTEALIARIYVHVRLHLPRNLVLWWTRMFLNLASVPNSWTPGLRP